MATAATLAPKEREALKKEAIEVLIRKAGVSKKSIIDVALSRWASLNLDLLSPAERKKYQPILR